MGRPAPRSAKEELDPYDVAFLLYNSSHVVTVALVSLAHAGAIDCGERVVEAFLRSRGTTLADLQVRRPALPDGELAVRSIAGDAPLGDPVERAVYDVVVRTPVSAGNLAVIRSEAAPAVRMIVQERLERRGLFRSGAARAAAIRRAVVVVSVIGMVAVVIAAGAGVWRGNWYGLIIAPLLAVLLGTLATLFVDVTLQGRLHLLAARWRHPRPIGVGRGKSPVGRVPGVGFVVALYGELFLWRYDPALAFALGLEHINDLEGWGGG